MNALTTVFTPPVWCADRYAVFIATPPWDSTNVPSSGWVDPSFTKCIPSQYSETYPSFSPGICPHPMTIVASESNISGRRTVWTGRCCQSGFTTPDMNPDFFCTSAVTAPIPLLLIPAITTTDVYTTLPGVKSIQHDQITVLWEETDLSILPRQVAGQYASMMGLTGVPALTVDIAASNPAMTSADSPSPAPSTGPSLTPPLPPATTSPPSPGISTSTDDEASSSIASLMPVPESSTMSQLSTKSNAVTASFTSALSATTIRPPSQSWFPVSSSTNTGVDPVGTAYTTRTSSTIKPSQSMTASWPPSTSVNTSYPLRPQTHRLRNLCLVWTVLFATSYFT